MGQQHGQPRREPDDFGSRSTSASTEELIEQARKLVGIRFKNDGRTPGLGIDCVGLLVLAARGCLIDLDDHCHHGKPSLEGLEHGLDCVAVRDNEVTLIPGRVAQMAVGMRDPIHVGIVARIRKWPSLIHAWQAHGRVAEGIIDKSWEKRITATWKLKDIY